MKKKPLQDLLCSLNAVISTNESTEIITGHVIYNPAYNFKFQLKTTQVNISTPHLCHVKKPVFGCMQLTTMDKALP